MNSQILNACCLILVSSLAVQAENLVVNGDFESGEGNAFWQTKPWYNRGAGFNQGGNARSAEGLVISGAFSATVNDRFNTTENKFGPIAYVQKTHHIIEDGDAFALAYEWRPSDQFWQRSTDTIRFVLYATEDDKPGGLVVWSSELTSDFFRGNHTSVMLVEQETPEVDQLAVGKHLFVMFYGLDTVDGESKDPHWARVDNIEVTLLDR